jgi:outer membrane lipoprotein-sorting protein
MSNIEDVLRQFRPAREPEEFWNRILAGDRPDRETRLRRRAAWVPAAAAAMLFASALAFVTGTFRSGAAPVAPEEVLRRIREALETSETACIRFTLEPEGRGAPISGNRKTGVVFLKRGNKLNLSVKEWTGSNTRGVPETESRLISDGTRMERCLLRRGTEIEAEDLKPDSIAPALAEWYLRGGNLAAWPAVVDVKGRDALRDVRSAVGTPDAPAIAYKAGSVSVTLWYDPVSFKPLHRSLRAEGQGGATETYQEYELNEDMADSLFVLAKDKEK